MRGHLRDRQATVGVKQLGSPDSDRREYPRTNVVGILTGAIPRGEGRIARTARVLLSVLGQSPLQRWHDRNAALAGVGLRGRPGDAHAPAGEVEMRTVQAAQLRDARTGEDQRLDNDATGHVVAVASLRLSAPELSAAYLAHERV